MSNEAADQPTILDILSDYINYDDLPTGQYDELLDRLRDRDIVLQSDVRQRGIREGHKQALRAIQYRIEVLGD
jgi:hypothetical protein